MQPARRKMHVIRRYFYIFAQMVRIRTAVLMATFSYAGYVLAQPAGQAAGVPGLRFWGVALAITCAYAFGTSVNDLADEAIDKINLVTQDAERPLVKGNGNRSEVRAVAGMAALASIILAGISGTIPLVLVILLLVIGYVYSMPPLRLSYRGIIAVLVLPVAYVLIPFYGAFSLYRQSFGQADLLWVLGFYAAFFGRIILKDIRDVKGDTAFNKRTFIVRYGLVKTCSAAIAGWAFGCVLMILAADKLLVTVPVALWGTIIVGLLYRLQNELDLYNQLIYVAAVGRAGNATLLSVIGAAVSYGRPIAQQAVVSVGISLVFVSMVYETLLHIRSEHAHTLVKS